jgi:AcrR family transcriptional regulator
VKTQSHDASATDASPVGGRGVDPRALDPRVVRSREVVLEAARQLLIEDGRAGASIDAIAKRSGVARTTIYRHWPTLAALISAAFESMAVAWTPPDTGSLRSDLIELMLRMRTSLNVDCWGQVLPTMIDGTFRDDTVAAHQRAIVSDRRQRTKSILQRAVERGELDPSADFDTMIDRLTAPIFYRHLLLREPTSDAYVEALIDSVIPQA